MDREGSWRERYERLEQDLKRERSRLRALRDIGIALGSALDLDELLSVVLTRISRVMGAECSMLYLLDDETNELVAKYGHADDVHEVRCGVGTGLVGWVAKTGRSLNLQDAPQDRRFDDDCDRRTGQHTHSTICVPIKNSHGRIIGVMQVLNKLHGSFSVDDEGMLSSLAAQAAVSIDNSKLFLSVVGKNMELLDAQERLERKVRELDVLFEISKVSAAAGRVNDLLDGVVARAIEAIDTEAGSILLTDAHAGDLRFCRAVGGTPEKVRRIPTRAGEGISGWVAIHGEPQVVNDLARDPRHSKALSDQLGYHPRSALCVPLRLEDGSGALELLNKARGQADFNDDDLKLATVIAGQVATAINLARSRERRERQERLSTIGQLLSSVLHDLKTPLTIISGFARFIEDEHDAEARRGLGASILRQVDMIGVMTREILAFARGDQQVWIRKVYLAQYFETLLEQLELEFKGRDIVLALDLRDRGVAYLDEHKIRRAVHNLARNAAQAMGNQGGRFTIVVDRRSSDGALVLTFSDDGPGIPDEIRGRLFESFTTHGKPQGTGLGLAIVRKVVDDHGGTIEVSTRPGHTEFVVVLPQSAQSTMSRSDTSQSGRQDASA